MAKSKKSEGEYKRKLVAKISNMFPGCLVLKNDPTFLQGVPDLTVLWKDKWALLETKRESQAHVQPNQPYYVKKANDMSFAAIIYPENEEEVLHDLQQAFRT